MLVFGAASKSGCQLPHQDARLEGVASTSSPIHDRNGEIREESTDSPVRRSGTSLHKRTG